MLCNFRLYHRLYDNRQVCKRLIFTFHQCKFKSDITSGACWNNQRFELYYRYYAICHPTLFQANREHTNVALDCCIATLTGIIIQVPNLMEFDVKILNYLFFSNMYRHYESVQFSLQNQHIALTLDFRSQNLNVCLMMKMLRTLRACVMEKTLQLMMGVFIGIYMTLLMVIMYL